MYSVIRQFHPHKDKDGRQKIQIKITYKRVRVYLTTDFRAVPGSENPKIEAAVRRRMNEAEDRLIDAIRIGLTPDGFRRLFKSERSSNVVKYFDKMIISLEGNLSHATLKQYKVIVGKIDPSVSFSEISVKWMEAFEKDLHGLDINTINTNMKRLKAVLSRAAKDGQLSRDQFEDYSPPAYKQKLPEYLTEKEINAFTKIVRSVNAKSKKIAGWYFLLSCYTGWRISDVKRFSKEMIHGDSLVLRAKKNGQIVSMPVIPRLKEVLKFVSQNPFNISEQHARIFVKEIAKDAGITKKVKFHSARHSNAMLLMSNGFTIDEVAEMLGDSALITKVYARVHNESLHKKIRERLG